MLFYCSNALFQSVIIITSRCDFYLELENCHYLVLVTSSQKFKRVEKYAVNYLILPRSIVWLYAEVLFCLFQLVLWKNSPTGSWTPPTFRATRRSVSHQRQWEHCRSEFYTIMNSTTIRTYMSNFFALFDPSALQSLAHFFNLFFNWSQITYTIQS